MLSKRIFFILSFICLPFIGLGFVSAKEKLPVLVSEQHKTLGMDMNVLTEEVSALINQHDYFKAFNLITNKITPLKQDPRNAEVVLSYYKHFYNMVLSIREKELKNTRHSTALYDKGFNFLLAELALESKHYAEAADRFNTVLIMEKEEGQKDSQLAIRSQLDYAMALAGARRFQDARARLRLGSELLNKKEERPITPQEKKDHQIMQENIRHLIVALDQAPKTNEDRKSSLSATIAMSGGYDSNANTSTDSDILSFILPGGGILSLPLDDENQQLASSFGEMNTSAVGMLPVSETGTLFAQASLNNLRNFEESSLNTDAFNIALGGSYRFGDQERYEVIVPIQMQHLLLAGKGFVDAYVGLVDVSRMMNETNKLGVYTEQDLIRFLGESSKNIDVNIAGISWTKMFPSLKTILVSKLYAGIQTPRSDDPVEEKLARHLYGINFKADWHATEHWVPYASLAFQQSQFGGADIPYSLDPRRETYIDTDLGVNYYLGRHWKFFGDYHRMRNISNIQVHAYTRNLFEGGLSYTVG